MASSVHISSGIPHVPPHLDRHQFSGISLHFRRVRPWLCRSPSASVQARRRTVVAVGGSAAATAAAARHPARGVRHRAAVDGR